MAAGESTPLELAARLASIHVRRPQALAQAMEEEIAVRGLAAGTRLGTKGELRVRFGVATTTVNEAIRVLEHRGVVQVKPGPGGGVFVAERSGWLALSQLVLDFEHSATAMSEILGVRNALEGLIAAEAAQHHEEADLEGLRAHLEAMEAQVHDPAAYLRANWAFHRRVADLCSNAFARALYATLLDSAESRLARVAARGPFDGAANLATHRELTEAIASRDLDRVAQAVRRHNDASRVGSG